ncbi:hypothetical protein ACH36K_04450 [Clostridium sp. MB05]|jgi:MFS transporter, PPP family, 3-phenylpropionic acid transporter|uniref:hypothetical protein n=1 Tax=Clostridium sp. MB05 TaxID=3376682 RepID=UPI003982BECF
MTITNSYIVVLLITILHGFVAGAIFQIQNKLFGEIVEPRYQFSAFMLLGAILGTMLPSILNLITGNLYEKLGVGIFGATYLALTIIALVIMILSKIEKKNFGQ